MVDALSLTIERFWNKVDIRSYEDCWLWRGHLYHGYGKFRVRDKKIGAHRYSFFLVNGFYPPVVMHTCDEPSCVNPGHLVAGTNALNTADMLAKGRNWHTKKTHCKNGHPFNESNTLLDKKGWRHCIQCIGQWSKNRKVVRDE